MRVYKKLVRDKIPEIIMAKGNSAVTRLLSDEEFSESLKRKLCEEVNEYLADGTVDELADIYEVLLALVENTGTSFESFDELRNIPATTVNTVESYNDLFEVWKKNIPDTYLLFQDLDQKLYYISDSSYMPSQLFRKCLAPYLGANYWDWRSESYSNNILETISLFKGIIE